MNPSHLAALDVLTPSQREFVMDLFQQLRDPERTESYMVSMRDPKSPQAIRDCRPDQTHMADRCREPSKNVVILDQHGRLLLVYKPDFIPEPITKCTEAVIEKLLSEVELKFDGDDDRRGNVDERSLVREHGKGRFGVLYCACWMERGKPNEPPVVCSNMTSKRQANGYCAFAQGMKNLKERLGLLYAAADPSRWRHCVDIFRRLRHYLPTSQLLSASNIDPWISMAFVANVPTDIHRDRNDAHAMLSGIGAIGRFSHSWLVLPSVGIKLRINPHGAILVNTHVLAHFVHSGAKTETEGMETGDARREEAIEEEIEDRFVMSFFNHQAVQDWVRNEAKARAKRSPAGTSSFVC
jgi:hypothetical protein